MYGKEFEDELEAMEAQYPPDRKRAALLGALHAVQARAGHVTDEAVHWLAARYATSPADVQGVVSFYTMYFTEAGGRHVIWLCRTFSCQLMGAGKVMAALEAKLGCSVGQSDAAAEFRLRWMECLAACDKAPCALVDDDMYERLTPESVGLDLEPVRAGGGGGEIVGEGQGVRLAPLDLHRPPARGAGAGARP